MITVVRSASSYSATIYILDLFELYAHLETSKTILE